MTQVLEVRQSLQASIKTTGWFNRMLGPAVAACRFDAVPATIELRSLDWCAAFARRSTRDRSICLGPEAKFWSQRDLCETVLHEFAHMLVFRWEDETGREEEGHGPIFFLVLLALYSRVDRANCLSHNLVARASLYDFEDFPKSMFVLEEYQARGMVLRWAMEHYNDLALSPLPAEQLPHLAWDRWEQLMEQCKKWDADQEQAQRHVAGLQHEVARLRNIMARLVGAGWLVLVALLLMAWVMLIF